MDYAGNSNKAKEEAAKPEKAEPEEDKTLEKVVTGEVVLKKKGFGRKFRDLFFGADFKSVMNFVFEEKIVPGVKNALFDTIVGGSERALWGQRGPGTARHPGMSPKVQYTRGVVRSEPDPRHSARLPHQPPHGRPVNRMEANDIVFGSQSEAQTVIDTLREYLYRYEMVPLASLYELCGLEKTPIAQRWGWTHLNTAEIRQVREGYLLELPPLEEI